jgi:hypothetical protein
MKFTLTRTNIFYDTIEVDPEEIKKLIPEMVPYVHYYLTPEQIETQKKDKSIYYHHSDYSIMTFMRPNPSRLAADEFTVDRITEESNTEDGMMYIHQNKTGKKYIYSWGPDYDPGIWYSFYYDRESNESNRVWGNEYLGITIPRYFFEVPGFEYPMWTFDEEVELGDLEEWLQMCIGPSLIEVDKPSDKGWEDIIEEVLIL